jgi:hypothetical protein
MIRTLANISTLPLLNPLMTQSLKYFASKMQASSTQNGRDSKGRRLGYHIQIILG